MLQGATLQWTHKAHSCPITKRIISHILISIRIAKLYPNYNVVDLYMNQTGGEAGVLFCTKAPWVQASQTVSLAGL